MINESAKTQPGVAMLARSVIRSDDVQQQNRI